MWESLFGSAIAPTVAQGVGESAVSTALPALTDEALNTGIDQALAGTAVNSLGTKTAGLGLGNAFTQLGGQAPLTTAQPSAWDAIGNYAGKAGNFLTSDQGGNAMKIGVDGFNLYNQTKALNHNMDIQNQQLAQNQDAYQRNKTADERRQKLVF